MVCLSCQRFMLSRACVLDGLKYRKWGNMNTIMSKESPGFYEVMSCLNDYGTCTSLNVSCHHRGSNEALQNYCVIRLWVSSYFKEVLQNSKRDREVSLSLKYTFITQTSPVSTKRIPHTKALWRKAWLYLKDFESLKRQSPVESCVVVTQVCTGHKSLERAQAAN